MKEIVFYWKKYKFQIVLLIAVVLSFVFGCDEAGLMLAGVVPVTSADKNHPVDPVDPNTNNLSSPDGNGAGQDLSGTQASATQLKEGGLAEPEYDKDIVSFRPNKFVLLNLARTVATQRPVRDYEVTHFRIGDDILNGKTKQVISESAENKIKLTGTNYDGDLKLFSVGTTVLACGVNGYKDKSTNKVEGELMLYVSSVNSDNTEVTLRALNGPALVEGEYSDYLDDMKCPEIPSGTTLDIASIAGAESQQEVSPDNFQPRPKTVFLQKQIMNIVITEHQKRIITKTPWAFNDIKANGLSRFSKKAERTLWIGKQKRFKSNVDPSMGEEYTYTSEGILRQLSNMLGINDKITFKDITAITKLQFAEGSETDEAYALVGKDMLEDIINIDWVNHNVILEQTTTEYGVTIRKFKNNFGTLNIIYAPALNELGYSKFMVVIDAASARYYTNISKKEKSVDMSQGATGTREAERYIYIESSALALRGCNSILVGPSSMIAQRNISATSQPVTIVSDALPENPYEGMLIVLEKYIVVSEALTLTADKVYQYNGSTWVVYNGVING